MARLIPVAVLLCAGIARAANPPPPNPDRPVSYVDWINDAFARNVTDNAAYLYRDAIAAFVGDHDLRSLAEQTDAQDWTDAQRFELRRWIQENEGCLETFAAAARKRRCFFELHSPSGSLWDVMLPELSSVRHVARTAGVRARLRLLAGDVDGAMTDIGTLLRAARHMQLQPMVIQYLVGTRISAATYEILLDVPRLSSGAADFERVVKQLEDVDRAPPRPQRQLVCAKLWTWDFAQRYLRDTDGDGRHDLLAVPREAAEMWGWPDSKFALPRPQAFDAIVGEVKSHYEQWQDVFSGDYQQGRQLGTALERQIAEGRGPVLAVVGASFSRVHVVLYKLATARHASHIVLHLNAYQAKHGRWPTDLKRALPGKAARMAIDPFSGQPFAYRLQEGQPLLYCASENGVDDGGEVFRRDGKATWGETGDYVFWPRQ